MFIIHYVSFMKVVILYLFLGLGSLRQMPIPIFEKHRMQAWGDQIQQTLQSAYKTMLESTQLLEQAKKRVEDFILGEV